MSLEAWGDEGDVDQPFTQERVDEIVAEETAKLRAWIADLQAGMTVNCVYCGHRYGPDPGTPVAMADVLKAHIAECPEHPMSKLVSAALGVISEWKHGFDNNRLTSALRDLETALPK